jgi:hypothetical protein
MVDSISPSRPAFSAAAELPFLKAIPLDGDNGDTRLICLSLSLLDGKYDIEDCRRPFLTLTLLAPNGDDSPGSESALLVELCKAGEREDECDDEESTEPEASWRGRGPGDIIFNE